MSSSAPTKRRWRWWRRPEPSLPARASTWSAISWLSRRRRKRSSSCGNSSRARRRRFAAWRSAIRRRCLPGSTPSDISSRRISGRSYESRIVPTTNVRAALTAVETGGADAAIVYLTDLAAARSAVLAFAVPAAEGPRIVYPAAVVAASRHQAEAQRFLAFLRQPEARAIFARYKFVAPARALGRDGYLADHELHAAHGSCRDGADDPDRPGARVAPRAAAVSRAGCSSRRWCRCRW